MNFLKRIFGKSQTQPKQRFDEKPSYISVKADTPKEPSPKKYSIQEFFHFLDHFDELVKALDEGMNPSVQESKHQVPLLGVASKNGYTEIVELLIQRGSNVNNTDVAGGTALFEGARSGHFDICKLLLDAGANPDAWERNLGHSAITIAVFNGHADIVELLVESGAKTDVKLLSGTSLSELATKSENQKIRELILGA